MRRLNSLCALSFEKANAIVQYYQISDGRPRQPHQGAFSAQLSVTVSLIVYSEFTFERYKGETNLRGRSASMAGRPVAGTHGSLGTLYEPRLSPPCV